MRRSSPAFILAALSALAAAPAARADTLTEAIAKALARDPQLASERTNIDAAKAARQFAFAQFMPSLSGEITRGATWSNGAVVDPATNATRAAGNSENGAATVAVDQTLFSSGRLLNGYGAARSDERRAEALFRGQEDALVVEVVNAYAGVLYGEEAVRIEREDVERLAKEVDAANIRFEAGAATKTDVYQAQTQLAAARSALAAAQADLAAQRATYNRRVGEMPATLERPALPDLPADVETAAEQARARAPEVAAAREALEAAKRRTRGAYADYFPTLSVSAAAERAGDNGFEGFDNDSAAATLRLSVPLWSGGRTTASVRAAKAAERGAEYSVDDSLRASDEAVQRTWAQFDAARLRVDATAAQLEAASFTRNGAEIERREGLRTQLDLLDAIANENTAALAVAAARRDELAAAYQVLRATGNLPRPQLAAPLNHRGNKSVRRR